MKLIGFFLLILLLIQLLSWCAARALAYLFRLPSKIPTFSIFFISNGLLLLLFLRSTLIFRFTAFWWLILWFITLTALSIYLINQLFKNRLPQTLLRFLAVLGFVGLMGISIYNAYTPTIKQVHIHLNKPLAQPIRIGMVADTHLGTWVGVRQIDKLTQIMTQQKVDLILIPGDIMDDNTDVYEAENMRPHLEKLRAPLGVYASLGNHDLFGHQHAIKQALNEAGITVLDDKAIHINQQFWVVGRLDDLFQSRLATSDLLKHTNPQQPIFLLDHRPSQVAQHAQLPIDLQVSGHVHNGQVFPANLLIRFLNRIHYGYERINQTHFVVTSGYGFWGIPFRLGSQAEVWIIDVTGITHGDTGDAAKSTPHDKAVR